MRKNVIIIINLAYKILIYQRAYVLEPIKDSSGNYLKFVTLKRIFMYNFVVKNALFLYL